MIFKYWYWYFLFQKCTEILILQYSFYHQYQYFSKNISLECMLFICLLPSYHNKHFAWSYLFRAYVNFYNQFGIFYKNSEKCRKFRLQYRYRNLVLVLVPNTKMWFGSRKDTDTEYWYFSFFCILILILIQYSSNWVLILILQYLKIILDTEY